MIPFPDKKYKIIYADPPWEYNDPKGNDPAMGGITYPTMSNGDICSLPVKDIADNDCGLFMWATVPKLKEAFVED
jgi:N6-adenosine-specific RNA methylase IME4